MLLALCLVWPAAAADNPFQDPFGDGLSMAAAPPSPEKLPTVEESVRRKTIASDACPSLRSLRSIGQVRSDVAASRGDFPPECGLGQAVYRPRSWGSTTFTWTASALCHRPLYFEDEQLERYGHSRRPMVQYVISPAKFFLTFPVLPYKMGLYPPRECIYTLGTYRPGDRSPCLRDAIPWSVRASVVEAGSFTGAVFALP